VLWRRFIIPGSSTCRLSMAERAFRGFDRPALSLVSPCSPLCTNSTPILGYLEPVPVA
jgi:hypothetical protein